MTHTILLCTVGGSHQPILTAIRELAPVHTSFFCTGNDPATGRPGSRTQIEGKGNPVEVRRGDQVERLPNIPTQAGLAADAFSLCEIPADDLDTAVRRMLAEIDGLRVRFPEAALIADYTGGTKTMTAALAIAALERPGVELRLVTGARADLVRVYDGTEAGGLVGVEGIRLRRGMAPFLAAWDRFAYGEAAVGLTELPIPRDPKLRAELQIARDLSRAFDAWDRFDHRAALAQLEVYSARLGAAAAPWFIVLRPLNSDPDEPRRTPARLWDLWLNAQRRAAQCRYDDAVARGYRLLEWTAQWLLGTVGIDTGDLREDQIPQGIRIHPSTEGKRQAGLLHAWELAAHHIGGEVARFIEGERSHLLDQLRKRNYSILAHGDQPIARCDWDALSAWIESALLPMLRNRAASAGLKTLAPQLPRQPLWV